MSGLRRGCLCTPIVHRGRTVGWRGHPDCPLHQAPAVEPLGPGEIARTEHMVLSVERPPRPDTNTGSGTDA
jgi:hypothetical protein